LCSIRRSPPSRVLVTVALILYFAYGGK